MGVWLSLARSARLPSSSGRLPHPFASSGWEVVGIGGRRYQRERLSDLHAPTLVPFDLEVRGDVRAKLVSQTAEVPTHFGGDHLFIDLVIAFERGVCVLRLPVGRDGPDQLFAAEIVGDADREQERVASGVKMGRLPLIGASRFDAVVGTDRNVELLQPVRVHVPEEHREGPVLVRPPPFVGRRHTLAT